MGKLEHEDSLKVLAHESIRIKTRFNLKDLLLWPFRVYKQKRREAEIRKNLFKD